MHYSDLQVSPQWHQWLRHTRLDAPTLQEQHLEVQRQQRIKHLARLADERWASKPSLLDGPQLANNPPETRVKDTGAYPAPVEGVSRRQTGPVATAAAAAAAGEDWRPQAWNPVAPPAKKL